MFVRQISFAKKICFSAAWGFSYVTWYEVKYHVVDMLATLKTSQQWHLVRDQQSQTPPVS